MAFLQDKDIRVAHSPDHELYTGKDPENKYLEVMVQEQTNKPTNEKLLKVWKTRQANRSVPLLVVFLFQNKAFVCGPSGEKPPVYFDLDLGQVQRMCITGLKEPDRHAANRSLSSILESLGKDLPGINNQGFLADHDLRKGVKKRKDWNKASKKAREVLQNNSNEFLKSLGFETKENDNFTNFLIVEGRKRALAVLLKQGESPEASSKDFVNQSPVTYGLSIATKENLPYLIIQSGETFRIYPTRLEEGVGRRGRTETYLEINTTVMSDEDAGYLWLIFSGQALKTNGTLKELVEASHRFGHELAEGLRNRIYAEVIPLIAKGIFEEKKLSNPLKKDLDKIYQISITILFRLLFLAYAEDRDLLPYKSNDEYKRNSLQTIANVLTEKIEESYSGDSSDSYWQQIKQLFKAVDKGNKSWSVPAYNGGLFSSNPEISLIGSQIEELNLKNSILIPALQHLLVEKKEDIAQPVDFRSLSVREFGSIYEALLETELFFASEDLVVDRRGNYRPAKEGQEPLIKTGEIFTQNARGARKETASFYTKDFAIDHLLNQTLQPALEKHCDRLDGLDDESASEAFFDFKLVDIAMGSGHFLVAAIDRIEVALENYRNKRPLARVSKELSDIRQSALLELGELQSHYQIEDAALIRRLIAKHCVYGVDLNPMAVQLASLSIWIHTFVPGLPLSFLDRNLIIGNSLAGIGRVKEIKEIIEGNKDKDHPQVDIFGLDASNILGDAVKDLNKLALINDSTLDDIKQSRKAWDKAKKALRPAFALADILYESKLKKGSPPVDLIDKWESKKNELFDSDVHQKAKKTLKNLDHLHFPLVFPEVFLRKDKEGFDLVIGNPPWEEAMVDRDGFWALYNPGLRSLKQIEKNRVIEELSKKFPELEKKYESSLEENQLLREILLNGSFPGMGTGDADIYKAFCWRFIEVSHSQASIGVVLPRTAFNALGSKEFRKKLFLQDKVEINILLNSNGWVFDDAEHRYTIALLSVKKGEGGSNKLTLKGPYSNLKDFDKGKELRGVKFLGKDVFNWNESLSLPLLPSTESGEIFKQFRKFPNLDEDIKESWRARPHREMDATNDGPKRAHLFDLDYQNLPKGYWPVYKGSSFDLWEPDTGDYFGGADPEKILPILQQRRLHASRNLRSPFFEFNPEQIRDSETHPALKPRIVFRQITNRTNTRTFITCLIPPKTLITNHGPYFLWPRGDELDEAYLLGVMSSRIFDWYVRRYVEINLNFFLLNGFPVPRPKRKNNLFTALVELSGRLASPDERFSKWAKKVGVDHGPLKGDEKLEMINELNSIVAHLYGFSEKQLIHIFETFHEGWEFEPELEATLVHYKDWANKL